MEKKILNDPRKIVETLLGKTEVIRNWYWYYKEIKKKIFWNNLSKIKKKRQKKF